MSRIAKVSGSYQGPVDPPKGDVYIDNATKGESFYTFRISLRYRGRSCTFYYHTNTRSNSPEPRLWETLNCLLVDARCGENDFRDFCGEFGYDKDSRKAERTWKACKANRAKAQRFLGDKFDEFTQMDEDDLAKHCEKEWRD